LFSCLFLMISVVIFSSLNSLHQHIYKTFFQLYLTQNSRFRHYVQDNEYNFMFLGMHSTTWNQIINMSMTKAAMCLIYYLYQSMHILSEILTRIFFWIFLWVKPCFDRPMSKHKLTSKNIQPYSMSNCLISNLLFNKIKTWVYLYLFQSYLCNKTRETIKLILWIIVPPGLWSEYPGFIQVLKTWKVMEVCFLAFLA